MIKRFSTKILRVIEQPTYERMGVGVFEFTDDYSVFHFGKMPDQIPGKGEAICRMTAVNLGLLEEHGIKTHFKKFIPPNQLEVQLVRILNPKLNSIQSDEHTYFIPLQIIFRNTLPPGSSVFRRLERGNVTFQQLGLTKVPEPGAKLEYPLIEFTTKEKIDKYIDEDKAKVISGLDEERMNHLKQITLTVNEIITRKAESLGLEHADGKIEFAITESGTIMVVDSVGTPDENRFIYKGIHIGKQVLRDYYASLGLENKVYEWTNMNLPKSEWPVQQPLPSDYLRLASNMYRSLCETWTGTTIWGAPKLDEIAEALRLRVYMPLNGEQS